MKILVTGGAGFIGSHTCVELLNSGYEIVIADNFSNSKPEVLNRLTAITRKPFDFCEADIRDRVAMDAIFDRFDIGAVIHFAGLKSVGESVEKPLEYYSHNLNATFTLCESMEKHRVGCLIFSSSATVYGSPDTAPVREDFPLGPTTNPYGETKLMQERILRDLESAGVLDSVYLLRYFNPIGAHESGLIGEDPNGIPNNLLPYISKVSVGKLPYLSVYGNDYPTPDGSGIRDYIHVVDLARAHAAALRCALKKKGTHVYNIGTGRGYSVFEIIAAYEKATGRKVPYVVTDRRPGDVAVSYSDPSLAEKELGWKAEYGIERMCVDADRWQTKNPDGYETIKDKFFQY
ncbi:MAG: UDP-glucose 4-epimerase GalE [Clostridia bacterium]|nr:UDP-glucose 4-epimerase GalE [Clostridia bacterium]